MNIPKNCRWATFLRNHDELALDMVEEEERADMRIILNLGLRSRLASLLDNKHEKIDLLYALLFSIPGNPFMYYGDELGMGDNIYLYDRDGLRIRCNGMAILMQGFHKRILINCFYQ